MRYILENIKLLEGSAIDIELALLSLNDENSVDSTDLRNQRDLDDLCQTGRVISDEIISTEEDLESRQSDPNTLHTIYAPCPNDVQFFDSWGG